MIKSITNFLIFLYFSSLNLKYLKLTKMELSRFAMKLFTCKEYIAALFYCRINLNLYLS